MSNLIVLRGDPKMIWKWVLLNDLENERLSHATKTKYTVIFVPIIVLK